MSMIQTAIVVLVWGLASGLPAPRGGPAPPSVTAPRGGGKSAAGAVAGRILGAPARALAAFGGASERHPITTNVVTGGVVMGLGDACCQRLTGERDGERLRNAIIVGCTWQGLCIREIFGAVDRCVDRWRADLAPWADVCARTLAMQCVLSTGGNYVNLGSRRLLAGGWRDWRDLVRGVNAQWPAVCRTDWTVWPFYLAVAFALIPPSVRPTTTAFMNAAWGIYISLMAARAAAHTTA